jgi:hypothetical protein
MEKTKEALEAHIRSIENEAQIMIEAGHKDGKFFLYHSSKIRELLEHMMVIAKRKPEQTKDK